ncbi:MAG: D-alanine--D-alanine ligase A, partial [Clostridia bacterium]|nr:D-alanine--D-alanine ligase A [Clostridia bacterium]
MGEKIKVTVLFGGQSSEHEVSRISAQCVLENIDHTKFDIQTIGITKAGEWLKYDGDIALIGSGDWEASARSKLLESGAQSGAKKAIGSAPTCMDLVSFQDDKGQNQNVDVVFPVLHGPNGEDGSVQGLSLIHI